MLLLPIVFALIASAFHKYPFEDRVMIFSLPAFIILIVNGIYFAVLQVKKFKPIVAVVFLILIMGPMTLKAAIFVVKPQREEIKDVLTSMEKNIKNGDKIFVAYYAERAFSFYKERYELSGFELINGHRNKEDIAYINEIKKLNNQGRVWFVFTYWEKNRNEDLLMTRYLKENYQILHEINSTEATGLLVDMTEPKSENLND
jgi:DNA polymerase III epsilon subunit-like protein